MTPIALSAKPAPVRTAPLRIGFVGLGWIGLSRCQALLRSGLGQLAAYLDYDDRACQAARQLEPRAARTETLAQLLALAPDGVVIATPSGLHAEQAVAALQAGCPVFCQKPLGRDGAETRRVVEAARRADRLLDVDFCYRHLRATRAVQAALESGATGNIFACNLVFHNASGPDKQWYYQFEHAGGGCLIDLGIHLVDLVLELLDPKRLRVLSAAMFTRGERLQRRAAGVEDYAVTHLVADDGCDVVLACSWNLPVGCEALISAEFFGTKGGVALRNVNGSFYDFQAELNQGTKRTVLEPPPDDWGGRAIVDWAGRLQGGARFDPRINRVVCVAQVLDEIYGAAGTQPRPPAT
jgi:predicted dehydrogenase